MDCGEQRYQWPQGKSCAAAFTADVDAISPYVWRMRGQPIERLGELEQRRFGPRAGIYRLLDLLDEVEVKGTFFVPGHTAELWPEILPEVTRRGHEAAMHGYYHEQVYEIDGARHIEVLDRCAEIFQRQIGETPKGYRSPSWEVTPALLRLLCDRNVAYDSSLMGYDHPYSIDRLVEIPVQWMVDDGLYFRYAGGGARDSWYPANPRSVLETWIEEFEGVREFGGMFVVTVHPWNSGRGQRIRLLRRLFRHIRQYDDVWWATALEIAEYHRSSDNAARFDQPLGLPDTNI